jgi:hypothetical protein
MQLYDKWTENYFNDARDKNRANSLIKKGDIQGAMAIVEANKNLELVAARPARYETSITTINNVEGDGADHGGIEVIVWDEFWTANPGNMASSYGHVSYVIDGVSYSFDSDGYHSEPKPDTYIDKRRETSGGTGYVLDFGSADLNAKFKQMITNAYKNADGSIQSWTATNNCAYAFKAAINAIAGQLGVPTDSAIKPSSHGAYIQKNLKSFTTAVNTYHYIKGSGTLK